MKTPHVILVLVIMMCTVSINEGCSTTPMVPENIQRECKNGADCTPTWGGWSDWGACSASVTCGFGSRLRELTCIGGVAGIDCKGQPKTTELQMCIPEGCTAWTEWGDWGACSVSPGEVVGTKGRIRECPGVRGWTCKGPWWQDVDCTSDTSPLSSKWTAWSSWFWSGWGSCPQETNKDTVCSPATWKRTRDCIGGDDCPGNAEDLSVYAGPLSGALTSIEQTERLAPESKDHDNAKSTTTCPEGMKPISCRCSHEGCDKFALVLWKGQYSCEARRSAMAKPVKAIVRCVPGAGVDIKTVSVTSGPGKAAYCPDGYFLASCGFQYGWRHQLRGDERYAKVTEDNRGCGLEYECPKGQGCTISANCIKVNQ